jgi:ankyrin repeat protein
MNFILYGCYNDTQTQMVICAANNDKDCITKLLDNGADINGHGKEGVSPFYAALKNKNFTVADVFVDRGINLYGSSEKKSYLMLLINFENYEAIEYLLKAGYKLKEGSVEMELINKSNNDRLQKLFMNK